MKPCQICAAAIRTKTKSGLCRSCSAKHRAPSSSRLPRVALCADCSTPIPKNKSGRCKSCATIRFNSLPETIAKRKESWARRLREDPLLKRRLAVLVKSNFAKAMTDPEKLKQAQDRGRYLHRKFLATPEVQEKIRLARPATNAKIKEGRIKWCPPEYRETYRASVKRLGAKAARAAVEQIIRAERQRPKTFEEKLQAVMEGRATIYTIPTAANSEPEFTLGGVSSGWAA